MSVQLQSKPVTGTGARRRKMTMACEVCRKRKARCSGVAPCDLCRKYKLHCEFNFDRLRRGPHPKTRDQGGNNDSSNSSPAILDPSKKANTASNTRTPIEGSSLQLAHQEGEGEVAGASPTGIRQASWRDALRKLLEAEDTFPGETKPPIGIILHLLEVFRTHVRYQAWMLDVDSFLSRSIENRIFPALIYAVCAVSVNFSRHESVTRGKTFQSRFASLARRRLGLAPERRDYLDRIQTLCVLVLYEFGEADGKQAWCDIAAAHSIMQVALAGDFLSADEIAPVNLAYGYLRIAQRELCLGQSLIPSIGIDNEVTIWTTGKIQESTMSSAFQVSEALDLLLKVSAFSREAHDLCDLNPSTANSKFMSHRQALDKFFLFHQDELQFDPEGLCEGAEESRRQYENLQCSLAWHCCNILLNRVYLPVPKEHERRDNTRRHRSPANAYNQMFPIASGPSTGERIRACEMSASIICGLCQDVMTCGTFLLPLFMGYCCFQSSIVLINQLRRTQALDPKVIEDLKTSFTILGAMRTFYVPARKWVDTLFEIHQPDAHLSPHNSSVDELFSTYFARFKNIKEPPYIPLEKPQLERSVSLGSDSSPVTTRASNPLATTIGMDNQGNTESEYRQAWMKDYRNSLQSHIMELDGDNPTPVNSSALLDKNNSPRTLTSSQTSSPAFLQQNIPPSTTASRALKERFDVSFNDLDEPMLMGSSPSHHVQQLQSAGDNTQEKSLDITSSSTFPDQPILQTISRDITYFPELEDMTNLDDLQGTLDSPALQGYLIEEIDFSSFLDAANRIYPPDVFPTYNGSFDWMVPDPDPW